MLGRSNSGRSVGIGRLAVLAAAGVLLALPPPARAIPPTVMPSARVGLTRMGQRTRMRTQWSTYSITAWLEAMPSGQRALRRNALVRYMRQGRPASAFYIGANAGGGVFGY
jgi:hypothetical protein